MKTRCSRTKVLDSHGKNLRDGKKAKTVNKQLQHETMTELQKKSFAINFFL